MQPTPSRTRIADPYHPEVTSENFDFNNWIYQFDPQVLTEPRYRQVRVELTRCDPALFSLIYLRHHITSPVDGSISFAECHLEWLQLMRQWVNPHPGLREWRHSFASPRDSGKSTWWYTIAPIWAGAHGHAKFVAAFADSGTQAEMHLQTFRSEAQHNLRLRRDFPQLCIPIRKPTGKTVADNEGMFHSASGFIFAARGIDTASLGMKVGTQRPDVLICDDIEKDESSYGDVVVEKRRKTLTDAIFPLNEGARVVLVGTVTRPGSLVHQLVKVAKGLVGDDDPNTEWIRDEQIRPHYYPPIIDNPDGTQRSIWPQRWPLGYLLGICHTRSYAKNYANDPRSYDGEFWTDQNFKYGDTPDPVTRWFLWVDPPTTQGKKSDYAGVAILGYAPGPAEPTVQVWVAEEKRLTGKKLGAYLCLLNQRFTEQTGWHISAVMVETNQGGQLWPEVFDDLPLPVRMFTESAPKPVRFTRALSYYEEGRVYHIQELTLLEERMLSYPNVKYDDIIDPVASGVLRLLTPRVAPPKSKTRYPR